MPRNISPTTAQRAALGAVVKMIQDPLNYKQLLLFGSQGGLICADHTASSPTWRAIRLSATSGLAWSQAFTFADSDGGWTAGFAPAPATYSSGKWNSTHFNPASGQSDSLYILSPSFASTLITTVRVVGFATYAQGTPPGGRNVAGIVPAGNLPTGAGAFDTTVTLNTNLTQISVDVSSNNTGDATPTSGKNYITRITINGTGPNPFGGSGGGGSNITYFGDMVGSINKKGWFGWLGQDETDVWFYYTTNYFQTRLRVNVAAYDSNKIYTISVGSYGNNTTKGVVLVTAGASIYKSTNYGVSFSDLSIAINDSGGPLVVPFAKNGGAVNAGTSPQYLLVKGVSTNLQARSLAGSTVTLASGSSHVPIGPYSLNVFKQDGAYCWCIMSDGTFYTSVDGGGTWSAQATPTHTGTVYGASGSPKNLAFVLAFGNECLAYSADSGASWTSLYSSYRTWADANIGSGKAQTIVTALVDLALLYSKPVSQ